MNTPVLAASTPSLWGAAASVERIEPVEYSPVITSTIADQVEGLRRAFGRDVIHLHLDAPRVELAARCERRRVEGSQIEKLESYDQVALNATEANVSALAADADAAINSKRCSARDVLVRAAAALGLLEPNYARLVDVLWRGVRQ